MNEKDNSNSAFAIQHSEFKVPEIRFKGFSGEWKNLVLGGNARFSKGQGYSKSDLVTSGSPIILYGRLYTKYQTVITEVDTFVNEKSKTIKSIGGEVIVPASGESPEDISRASVVNDPNVILGGDLNVIYPDRKIDSIFLALAISNGRIKKELSSKAQGKSVVHIRNLDLADLSLLLPSKNPEQIKIGNYFQKLDTLINQHQQKHDKLTNIKKAMLEKMFPKAGATMPEIRFKGFSGEWIGKKLNDEVEFFSGLTYSPNDIRKFGTLVLRSSNVKNGQLIQADNVYVNPEIVNCINVVEGDVIVVVRNGSRSLIGKHALVTSWVDNTVIGAFMTGIRSEQSKFINALLNTSKFTAEVEKNLGATINQITTGAFKKMEFSFPTEPEQTAIGNYFQKLDSLINQHQKQISKLKQIKQACLSKMFI